MTMISRSVGRAMATAVTRTNENPQRLVQRLTDALDTIDELRRQLRERDARIADLHTQLDHAAHEIATSETPLLGRGAGVRPDPTARVDAIIINNRPVITVAEAAMRARVSHVTAWRYVTSGHWAAVQEGSRWLVYLDQPLTRKSRA